MALGALAQLEEHLLCKQGVRGSSPLSSTRQNTESGGVCDDPVPDRFHVSVLLPADGMRVDRRRAAARAVDRD